MALIKCKEYRKEISTNAVSCPNCGYAINKTKKFVIFNHKSIFVNLLIFIITIPILLSRSEIVKSQNKYIKIWTDYFFEQERYRNVVLQTNIIAIIAILLIVYAIITTYKMFKEKNIKSKILDFIVTKIKSKQSTIKEYKVLAIIFTIITLILIIVAFVNEKSFALPNYFYYLFRLLPILGKGLFICI